MKNEGYSPKELHYSSLLNAYSVEGNHSKADALVKDMKSAGLVPNKVSLTTLLKAMPKMKCHTAYCCLLMTPESAYTRICFDEIETREIKSDGYCHSILISAFCRSRRMEEAKQLARDFEATYEKYDLVMLNTLLRAYCRGGEIESVVQLLRKMDELSISPDNNTFHILIKYFCK
ncbi:hypothetical protein MKX01_021506 [Papaver californicum]|nr:hypothetical protein MKX01_021506 [Papaver californicum]